jgi:hypothetical protein
MASNSLILFNLVADIIDYGNRLATIAQNPGLPMLHYVARIRRISSAFGP